MPGREIPAGLDNPTRNQYFVVLAVGACELAIVGIWGHQIIAFAVSHGIRFFWETPIMVHRAATSVHLTVPLSRICG